MVGLLALNVHDGKFQSVLVQLFHPGGASGGSKTAPGNGLPIQNGATKHETTRHFLARI